MNQNNNYNNQNYNNQNYNNQQPNPNQNQQYYQNNNYQQYNQNQQNHQNQNYNQQYQNQYNQMPNHMHQSNHLGRQFEQKSKFDGRKIGIIAIVVGLLIAIGLTVWFFMKKDINDYSTEDQLAIAFNAKVEEVMDKGTDKEKQFAIDYVKTYDFLIEADNDSNSISSVNDGMTTIDEDVTIYVGMLSTDEYKNNNEVKQEFNNYINVSLNLIDEYQEDVTYLSKSVIPNLPASNDVDKQTVTLLKQGVDKYNAFLVAYEDYLKKPSNDKHKKVSTLHREALSLIHESAVEYIK